jgi:hypothetical protein
VTAYLTVLNPPWIIKLVYGIVSDFVPLFGYRRKAYLILANAAATGAYFSVARITVPGPLVFVLLLLTAYLSSALSDNISSFVYEQAFHRHLVPLAERQGIQHARLPNAYRKNIKGVSIDNCGIFTVGALCRKS